MIPFNVEFKPGVPAYQQVIYAARKAIISGRLRPGDGFPSVRTLSQELKINPNTGQKIIARLVGEKLIEITPGIGSAVAQPPAPTADQLAEFMADEVEHLVVTARQLGLSRQELNKAIEVHWRCLSKGGGA